MHWPQIVMIIVLGFGLGCAITNHGKPRDNENALHTVIGHSILAAILWWGGFWG